MQRIHSLKRSGMAVLIVLLFSGPPCSSIAQNPSISEQSVENHVTTTRVATTAWFAPERYAAEDLSAAGQQALQQMAELLLLKKTEFAGQMPGLEVNATVTITCYSRQPTFHRDSALFAALDAKQIQLPINELERRQALNLHLSALRAETLSAVLRELLTPHDRADPFLKIRYRPEGQGETLPPHSETSPRSDTEASQVAPHYIFGVEFAFKERGPRVSRPTDTILYEIIEEDE